MEIAADEKHGNRSQVLLISTMMVVIIFICKRITDFWRKTNGSTALQRYRLRRAGVGTREGVSRLLLNFAKLPWMHALLFHPYKYRWCTYAPQRHSGGERKREKTGARPDIGVERREVLGRLEARLSILKITRGYVTAFFRILNYSSDGRSINEATMIHPQLKRFF